MTISKETFKPQIYAPGYSGTKLVSLPLPVIQCDIVWPFKSKVHNVPKGSGAYTYGVTLDAVTIQISGAVSSSDASAADLYTESDMWDALEDLRARLITASETNPLEFLFYYDTATPTYRKFKNVFPDTFQTSMGEGEANQFRYSLSLRSNTPTIYTTAPGV